jgi:N-acyl amino acid synthase of PEP-CTERM/exosortase system
MEYACAVMEPSLLRLLSHFGIRFTPIGALLDYHGLRQPCYLRVADFLQQLHRHNHAVWEIVTDGGRLGGAFTEPRQIAP